MVDEKGGPHTAHTTEPVPMVLIGAGAATKLDTDRDWFKNQANPYALCDIAPTILDIMGNWPTPEMTGQSMLVRENASTPV
ncbi:MAG: hypothetical protein R2857_03505 [Vampirovibrionales bacterium]